MRYLRIDCAQDHCHSPNREAARRVHRHWEWAGSCGTNSSAIRTSRNTLVTELADADCWKQNSAVTVVITFKSIRWAVRLCAVLLPAGGCPNARSWLGQPPRTRQTVVQINAHGCGDGRLHRWPGQCVVRGCVWWSNRLSQGSPGGR